MVEPAKEQNKRGLPMMAEGRSQNEGGGGGGKGVIDHVSHIVRWGGGIG